MMAENQFTANDLPMVFHAKYLGTSKSQGLWGIKHTRKPVDLLVEAAKTSGDALPQVQIRVELDGLHITGGPLPGTILHRIDNISYGVQDTIYARVFALIVVGELSPGNVGIDGGGGKFMCHAFACGSKQEARHLTFALAVAFKHLAAEMRATSAKEEAVKEQLVRRIDLRTPSQIAEEGESETEA